MPRVPGAKNIFRKIMIADGSVWPFPAEFVERMEQAGHDANSIRKYVDAYVTTKLIPAGWNQEKLYANKSAIVEQFRKVAIPTVPGGTTKITAETAEKANDSKMVTDADTYYGFKRIKGNANAAKCDHKYIDNHGYKDAMSRIIIDNEYAVLALGPSGTGKTEGFRAIAEEMGVELVRFNMNIRTEPEDLEGRWIPLDEAGKFMFKDGPLLEAMIEGKFLLVDEVNASKASVMMMFHAILEHGHEYRVAGDKGNRVIKPHENFRIAFSANPATYAGTSEFNPAFLSRCIIFQFDYPTPATEIKIISSVYPELDRKLVETLCKFAQDARANVKKNPECMVTVNTRDVLKASRLIARMNFKPREAVQLAVLNGAAELDQDTHKALTGLANAIFTA